MFCPKCGTQLEEGDYKCLKCNWSWSEIKKDIKQKKQGISKKIKKNFLFFAILLMAIIIVIFLNSDYYKFNKATRLILKEKYADATLIIHQNDSEKSQAVLDFIKVEKAKQEFIASVEDENSNAMGTAYSNFKAQLDAFSVKFPTLALPKKLYNNYMCYHHAFEWIDNYFKKTEDSKIDFYEAFYNIQLVFLNDVYEKQGKKFTLAEMQERVNKTNVACQLIEQSNFLDFIVDNENVIKYCYTSKTTNLDGEYKYNSVVINHHTSWMVEKLINDAQDAVSANQESINMSLQEFDKETVLYNTNPDENYLAIISEDLNPIDEYTDLNINRNIIIETIKKDMLYFMLTYEIAGER